MTSSRSTPLGALIPALRRDVRLREEPAGAVLISDADDSRSRYQLLCPLDAFVVSLFNGVDTVSDVAHVLARLRGSPDLQSIEDDIVAFAARFPDFIETLAAPLPERRSGVDPCRFLAMSEPLAIPARPHRPLWVDLYMTRRCNLRCIYCFADARYVRRAAAPTGVPATRTGGVLAIVDQILALDLRRILITGGEPLLAPDLVEVIGRFSARGVRVQLATNAALLDDSLAGRLREVGLRDVQAKLDSSEPAIQDELCGVRGSFDTLINGIRILKAHSFVTSVASVVTARNVRTIPRVVELCAELGVDEVRPRPYSAGIWALAGRGGEALHASADDIAWLEARLAELRERYRGTMIVKPMALDPLRRKPEHALPACTGMMCSCTILDNGLVVPCETLADFAEEFVMGDATQQPLVDIWASERTQAWLRRERPRIDGPCRSCAEFARCKGGCPWRAYVAYGGWSIDPTCIRAPRPTHIPFPLTDCTSSHRERGD